MSRDMGLVYGLLVLLCLGAVVAPASAQEDATFYTAPVFGYAGPTLTYQYQCSCGYGYGYSSPPPPTYPTYGTYSPPPPVEPTFPIPVPSPSSPPAYPSPSPAPYYYTPPTAPTYPAYPTYTYPTYPTYVYEPTPTYFGYGYGAYGGYGLSVDAAFPPSADAEDPPSASYSAASDAATLGATNATLAPGTCYCPYDSDWSAWAVSDTTCRAALYRRCKYDSRLPCTWLDQYYGAATAANRTATPSRPHESDISDYLYNDCPPAPPCQCAGERPSTTKAANGTPSYTCCKQLSTYSKVPFSGLSETAAEAVCRAYSPSATPAVRAWIERQLWHAQCPASAPQALYRLVDDPLLRSSRQAPSSKGMGSAGKAGVIGGLVGLGALAALGAASAYVYRKKKLAAGGSSTQSPLLA